MVAFRNTDVGIYYYVFSKHKEETVFNFVQVMNACGISMTKVAGVTAVATFKTIEAASGIMKDGTEKAAGSILGHIILLMAK